MVEVVRAAEAEGGSAGAAETVLAEAEERRRQGQRVGPVRR